MDKELIITFLTITFLLIVVLALKFSTNKVLNKKNYIKQISLLELNLNKGNYQTVVIDADKLLDSVLKQLKISGSTMGERLSNSKKLGLKLDDIWWVHKLRNRLVHEIDCNVSTSNAVKSIKIIKSALKTLGGI